MRGNSKSECPRAMLLPSKWHCPACACALFIIINNIKQQQQQMAGEWEETQQSVVLSSWWSAFIEATHWCLCVYVYAYVRVSVCPHNRARASITLIRLAHAVICVHFHKMLPFSKELNNIKLKCVLIFQNVCAHAFTHFQNKSVRMPLAMYNDVNIPPSLRLTVVCAPTLCWC